MGNFFTLVLKMPASQAEKDKVQSALDVLTPYKVGMSLDDEMTLLDLIESHPDFDSYIADEAREQLIKVQEAQRGG